MTTALLHASLPSQFIYCLTGEVENAEERTERAKQCPCPVHAKRGGRKQKDRLRVNSKFLLFSFPEKEKLNIGLSFVKMVDDLSAFGKCIKICRSCL